MAFMHESSNANVMIKEVFVLQHLWASSLHRQTINGYNRTTRRFVGSYTTINVSRQFPGCIKASIFTVNTFCLQAYAACEICFSLSGTKLKGGIGGGSSTSLNICRFAQRKQ